MTEDNVVSLVGLDQPWERPSVIKRLRDHHHLVARLVAEGKRTTDIAAETGLSISRVSILKGDPAFKQLVETYRMNVEQARELAFLDTTKKAALLLNNALDYLNERHENQPDDITPGEAQAQAEMAHMMVNGKITKNLNINATVESVAERHERRRLHIEKFTAELKQIAETPDDAA